MICPRRGELSSVFNLPKEDSWRHDNSCSYCGSLNPDALMERLERGDVTITPTDKSYKIYVDNAGGESVASKFYFQHLSQDQQRRFIELYNAKHMQLKEPGYFYVLPFFCGRS